MGDVNIIDKSMRSVFDLMAGPPVDNTYGEVVDSDKAPEVISKAVASLPPEQMFELMKQMKLCIQAALIMQVLQLSDEQIAMLPPRAAAEYSSAQGADRQNRCCQKSAQRSFYNANVQRLLSVAGVREDYRQFARDDFQRRKYKKHVAESAVVVVLAVTHIILKARMDLEPKKVRQTALLYIFNLIVGTGALTLPKAFFDAGWVLGIKMTVVMAMMSYITATFVIEAISRCHSIIQWERVERMKRLSREIVTGCFLLLFGPFVFFNVQKTKIIQMVTSFYRFTTFGVMIGLAIWRLSSPSFDHGSPVMTEWSATPALFGSLVYSFMCHHSLPGLIAPIKDKTNLYGSLAANYVIILLLYLTLGLTAVFAFPYIEDLYTLNFDPDNAMTKPLARIGYVLALFPVFTLTTSFPIISVTLRGNLQVLLDSEMFLAVQQMDNSSKFSCIIKIRSFISFVTFQAMFMRFPWRPLHSICLPILTVVPPVIIAMFTPKIEILVSITGSFAGMTIQYIIPAMLVLCARAQTPPNLLNYPNPYSSPFQSMIWPIVILLWAAICYTLVLYNLFTKKAIVDLF
ncbi:unnamed protein product [Nesidiocoris tenuis]|uniref:Amino acid transporter transmembrane domain-containing protein n=1 Tax=Nesidiocoris tenuis TaxID=355587 RepID=A0A6H5H070_9HEMI|nr:unnamed protein product [Nesidiocoris tenuis]